MECQQVQIKETGIYSVMNVNKESLCEFKVKI